MRKRCLTGVDNDVVVSRRQIHDIQPSTTREAFQSKAAARQRPAHTTHTGGGGGGRGGPATAAVFREQRRHRARGPATLICTTRAADKARGYAAPAPRFVPSRLQSSSASCAWPFGSFGRPTFRRAPLRSFLFPIAKTRPILLFDLEVLRPIEFADCPHPIKTSEFVLDNQTALTLIGLMSMK